jgi:acetylornithine deacetylase/succinyl-diaminopimelate desuccinylase-like protein
MRPCLLPALMGVAALVTACTQPSGSGGPVTDATGDSPRPVWTFTTDEAFDASEVPAYQGEHDEVYARIDRDLDVHVAQLQRWVRQRSISAQNDGVREMAELVAGDLRALGFQEVELVETDGHPGVWGYYDAGAPRTLMVYMMYDVQPIEANWRIADPFAGELVELEIGTVLMARGATNQKGPERAFLNAIDAILAVEGTLPVNLMVVAEGEEELGSPHFDQILEPYLDRLRTADGAFFPMNIQGVSGEADLSLGVKGILYFELEARGGADGGPRGAEIHGSFKSIVDSPTLRLVNAIASMTTRDGNTVTVPGYYDAVRGPSEDEQRLINGMVRAGRLDRSREVLDVARWVDGIEGRDAAVRHLFEPTFNVDGLWSGYTGEGVKTILPHVATAKIDSRLPPDLEPDTAAALIRRHLDASGYADLEMRVMSRYPAANSPVSAEFVQIAIGVLNKYGATPSVSPWLAGSAPFYQFTRVLGLPFVFGGLGYGTGAHAPDEHMLIHPSEGTGAAGLADVEKSYVDMLFALAGR